MRCSIEHHLYNPWDLAETNVAFLGGEIRSVREFEPDRVWRIEARVKSDAYPDGLVTSFFSYGFDGSNADELDFEFVSNATNDATTWPAGDPVLTNSWNETVEMPEYVAPAGLDLFEAVSNASGLPLGSRSGLGIRERRPHRSPACPCPSSPIRWVSWGAVFASGPASGNWP